MLKLLQTVLTVTTITYYHKCSEHLSVVNQTLHDGIVDYFFPKELRNPNIKMDFYLCQFTLPNQTCCQCTKTCKYYGTCCIDAFFDNNITSVEEYVILFLKMTNMTRYVSNLSVTSNTNISSYFNVDEVQTVTFCENKHSPYASLCNGNDSSNDVRVIADGFVYKNKYCALCHGFSYSFATLNLLNCKHSGNISGVKMTVPDNTFRLRISNDNELLGCKKGKFDNVNIKSYLPEINEKNCSLEEITLCFYSHFSLISTSKGWYANPQCAKCIGATNFGNENCLNELPSTLITRPPHFRLVISFDDDGNYDSILTTGQPVCTWDQYFDIFSNQCKTKRRAKCEKIILSDINSTIPSILWRKTIMKEQLPYNHVQLFLTHGKFVEVLGLSSQSNYFFIVPFKELTFTQLHGFSPQQHLLYSRVCADPQMIYQSFRIIHDCNTNSTSAIYNLTKDAKFWINANHGRVSPAAATCTHFYLATNCSMGALNSSITTVKSVSAIFQFNNEAKIHKTEQYVSLMEGFGICHKNEKTDIKYKWLKRYYYFENFVSIMLLSISLALELLLLSVYLTTKKTRNIPDKILIAFCVSLLICDVIAVTLPLVKESLNRSLCKIVALILHFFSLVLCTWPCIITYEFWKILRSTYTMKRQNFLYLGYSIIAWGIPLIVISICLSVDLIKNGSLIRYGNQDYCWISPFHARLAMYIIPLLLVSFGCFLLVLIVTLQAKHEKRKMHSMLSKKDQINFHKMATKLFLLFGIAELIGLVQIPNAERKGQSELIFNVIFGFLHNFLRGSRGIFMFTLFVGEKILEKCKGRSGVQAHCQ